MIGKKLYKNNKDDMAQYTATAIWCNANNAHIEDKGLYYEVCENVTPEPTTDEKIAQLDAQYNSDKSDLLTAYQAAQIYGDTDTMESLKADLQALDDQYDEDYERIVGEG
jgi:predicted negative regulator of RcsB-dependent stress response